MEYLTDLVTMVPEGTSPVKVDELRAAELAKAGHLVRLSGARRSVQANGAALGCSAPPMRQSFAKSSPRYPFISG
jgi:hypothetical protein